MTSSNAQVDATVGPIVKSSQKQGKENQKLIQWITAFCSSSSSSASSSIAIAIVFLNEAIRRRSLTSLPLVYHQSTDQNKILQSLMSPALMRSYKPSLFIGTRSVLNSAHAYMKKASIAASGSGSHPNQWQWREEIKCARDGALVALDWKVPRSVSVSSQGPQQQQQRQIHEYVREGPIQESIVLILHGVNTDTSFGYMQSMMNACVENGWIAVGMNQRGCGGVGLSTPRFANSAYTNDFRNVVEVLSSRLAPGAKLFLVGFSLGANTVVKYLGEMGLAGKDKLPHNVAGAASLCNPMKIDHSQLKSPWSQIFTLGMKRHLFQHRNLADQFTCQNYQKASRQMMYHSKTLDEISGIMVPHVIRNSVRFPFENSIGYENREEYWNESSSKNYIAHVPVPLLLCYASDDAISFHNTLAAMNTCLSNPNVILVQTTCGGHIGWNTATHGNFVDRTVTQFISSVIRKEHWNMVAESRMEASRKSRNLANGIQSKL